MYDWRPRRNKKRKWLRSNIGRGNGQEFSKTNKGHIESKNSVKPKQDQYKTKHAQHKTAKLLETKSREKILIISGGKKTLPSKENQ